MRKRIKCKFIGGHNETIEALRERYDVEECDERPEYVFLDCGHYNDAYKYDCIRILSIGENQRPNFNSFDYAYGFDQDLFFGTRYLYYPLYATKGYREDLNKALEKHMLDESVFLGKNKFCNMVVSNLTSASDERIVFFKHLSKYKKVDSAGKVLNNMPEGLSVKDKLKFQQQYKFSIAFENSTYPGYTTEKIIQAWAAGTIPIYWGDPTIASQFNEKAFINCHAYSNWDEVVARVREVDEDDQLYLEIQKQPIINENSMLRQLIDDSYYKNWLYGIIDKEWSEAYKRTNAHVGWGYYVDKDLRDFCQMFRSPLVRVAYAISKRIGVNRKNRE